MLTLHIEDKKIEDIFFNEFHSNKEKFFEFIQQSYEHMKATHHNKSDANELIKLQEDSMAKIWNSDEDEVWDEL